MPWALELISIRLKEAPRAKTVRRKSHSELRTLWLDRSLRRAFSSSTRRSMMFSFAFSGNDRPTLARMRLWELGVTPCTTIHNMVPKRILNSAQLTASPRLTLVEFQRSAATVADSSHSRTISQSCVSRVRRMSTAMEATNCSSRFQALSVSLEEI